MRIFDEKLKTNKVRYIFQSFLATLTMLSILLFLDILKQTAIIAALGATAFITFTAPKSYASKARPLIGGYIVGIFCGVFATLLLPHIAKFLPILEYYILFSVH